MDPKGLAAMAIIGIVAGWLASMVMGGGGLVRYLITGVLGAFVGPAILGALKINLGISHPLASQVITATIGAILVIFIARLVG